MFLPLLHFLLVSLISASSSWWSLLGESCGGFKLPINKDILSSRMLVCGANLQHLLFKSTRWSKGFLSFPWKLPVSVLKVYLTVCVYHRNLWRETWGGCWLGVKRQATVSRWISFWTRSHIKCHINTLQTHTHTHTHTQTHTLTWLGHIYSNEFCMDDCDPEGSNVRLSVVVLYGRH